MNITKAEKSGFASAMLAGILTHGFALFNKFSYLDDCTHYFDLGYTYSSGRWALGLIKTIEEWLKLPTVSMASFNGILSIFFLAIVAVFIIRMLKIEQMTFACMIGVYLVVFPTVTSTFAYMFTAPYYFFAALLVTVAVYLLIHSTKWLLLSAISISFAMGIYQAYFGFAVALFVMMLLIYSYEHSFLDNVKKAAGCFAGLVLGMGMYFGLNLYFIHSLGVELNQYQGINDMAKLTKEGLLAGIFKAYKIWLQLTRWNIAGISNHGIIKFLYAMCLILFLFLAGMYMIDVIKKREKGNIVFSILLFMVLPLSIGIIYVMVGSSNTIVHTLMLYSLVLIPVYPIALLQVLKKKRLKLLTNAAVVVICMMSFYYMWLDNMAYAKANFQQETAIAYYTVMLSEIKGTDGYSDEMPVIFLGSLEGQDSSVYNPSAFKDIQIQGYHTNMQQFLAYFAKPELFMPIHLGYRFVSPSEPKKIYKSKYVKKMPCYPEDQSIQIVEDVVVVKLSNHY